MEKQTNKKLHFFQSIHFKIALVFALLLLITFQIVGAVFVQRLKSENIKSFKQRVELSTYVDNSADQAAERRRNTTKANKSINTILEDINNENISTIQVIDSKGTIRGESDVNGRSVVGQKTTNTNIKRVSFIQEERLRTMYV